MGRSPATSELFSQLRTLDLEHVAVSATIGEDGSLGEVGELFEKLWAAAKSRAFPIIRTVVVARDQAGLQTPEEIKQWGFIPDDETGQCLYDPGSQIEILKARDLGDAVRVVTERDRRWIDIDCELPDEPAFFEPRAAWRQAVENFIAANSSGYLILIGGMGRGKSTFMARQIREQAKADGAMPAFHFIGHNGSPADACKCLYARLCRKWRRATEPAEWEGLDVRQKLDRLLKDISKRELTAGRKEVLYIDAADQLDDVESPGRHFLPGWLPRDLPQGVRAVITSRQQDDWLLYHRNVTVEDLTVFGEDERAEIGRYLTRRGGPRLSAGLLAAITGQPQPPVFFTINKQFERLESSATTAAEREALLSSPAPWMQPPETLVAEELDRLLDRARAARLDPHAVLMTLGLFLAARVPVSVETLQRLGLYDPVLTGWVLKSARSFFKRPKKTDSRVEPIRFDHDGYARELEKQERLSSYDLEQCHARLAAACGAWRGVAESARGYALEFRLIHLVLARDWEGLAQAFGDADYIVAAARHGQRGFAAIHAVAVIALAEAQRDRRVEKDFLDGLGEFERFLHWRIERMKGIEQIYAQEIVNEFHGGADSAWKQRLRAAVADAHEQLSPHLKKRPGPPAIAAIGHMAAVTCIAYSPDGRFVASGGGDGMVKVWDAESGRLLADALGHTSYVMSVSFSPDGRRVASGSYDDTVKVWDAESGRLVADALGHTNHVNSVSFSPDGRRVASGSNDYTVKVWDAESGRLVADALGHTNHVNSVSFSPDGRRVASGSYDKTVKVWDAESGRLVADALGHTNWVNSVSFSPDGRRVASGSWDHTVKVWDAESGRLVADALGHTNSVWSVSFSPDGRRVASGSWDHTVKVWDAESGRLVADALGHTNSVWSVSFSPEGRRVASGSWDHTVKVWDAESGRLVADALGHTNSVWSVSFSPDGRRVASGSWDHTVKVWDAESGRLVADALGHTNSVNSVSFSPDGRRVASGSNDYTVKVWDAESGRLVTDALGHTDGVSSVSFSPDGRRVASGSRDKTVKVWDAESGRLVTDALGHTDWVMGVSFSPDGRRVASGSWDKTVKVWDAESGRLVADALGHTSNVVSVSFSPDGRRVASGSNDYTVKVWDAESGRLVADALGHTDEVSSVSFSPESRFLGSTSADKTVRVWDPTSGRCIVTFAFAANFVDWSTGGREQFLLAGTQRQVALLDPHSGTRRNTLIFSSAPIGARLSREADGRDMLRVMTADGQIFSYEVCDAE